MNPIVNVARRLFVAYFLLLIFVLVFIGNPLKFIDQPQVVSAYKAVEPVLHVGLFAVLGLLVCASRWRFPLSVQAVWLVLLAAGSELIQFWLPARTPRLNCFLQDITGLFLGGMAWLMIFDWVAKFDRPRHDQDDWE